MNLASKDNKKNFYIRIRIASLAIFSILVLITLGAGYQFLSSFLEMRKFFPEGRMHSLDGYALHIYCSGSGSPTFILESDFGYPGKQWYLVQRELSKTNRVCSYDRAGMGWSETSHLKRNGDEMTQELYRLLIKENIDDTIVIVGYSRGALLSRLFAYYYPNIVEGIVLIDPYFEDSTNQTAQTGQAVNSKPPIYYSFMPTITWLGVTRLLTKTQLLNSYTEPIKHISIDAKEELLALTIYNPQYWENMTKEIEAIDSFEEEVANRSDLDDLPLVILIGNSENNATKSIYPITTGIFQTLQREADKLSSKNMIIECPSCGSLPPITSPNEVTNAILKIFELAIP